VETPNIIHTAVREKLKTHTHALAVFFCVFKQLIVLLAKAEQLGQGHVAISELSFLILNK